MYCVKWNCQRLSNEIPAMKKSKNIIILGCHMLIKFNKSLVF